MWRTSAVGGARTPATGRNLPIVDSIIKDTGTRALYLFSTKALAQDQLAELYTTIEALGEDIATFTYNGDTPQDARKAIRSMRTSW